MKHFEENIEMLIKAYSNNETKIVKGRYLIYSKMYDHYRAKGFPEKCSVKELSILPYCFQEAIHDSIDWFDQNTDLGHMSLDFEVDCMFHNQGKRRYELSALEFNNYIEFSEAALREVLLKATYEFPERPSILGKGIRWIKGLFNKLFSVS